MYPGKFPTNVLDIDSYCNSIVSLSFDLKAPTSEETAQMMKSETVAWKVETACIFRFSHPEVVWLLHIFDVSDLWKGIRSLANHLLDTCEIWEYQVTWTLPCQKICGKFDVDYNCLQQQLVSSRSSMCMARLFLCRMRVLDKDLKDPVS